MPLFADTFLSRLINALWYVLLFSMALSKGAASVALVALAVLGVVQWWRQHRQQQLAQQPSLLLAEGYRYSPIGALAALFGAYMVGCAYSSDLGAGCTFLYRANGLWLSPLVVALHLPLVARQYVRYGWALVGGTALACAVTLCLYALPETTVQQIVQHSGGLLSPYIPAADRLAFGLYSPFIDRLQFGNLIALSLLVGVALWYNPQSSRLVYVGRLLLLLLLLVTQLVLGARAAQLGTLLAMAWLCMLLLATQVYHLLQRRWGKMSVLLLTAICVAGMAVALPYAAYRYIPAVNSRYHQMEWEVDMLLYHDFHTVDYQHFTTLRRIVSWQNTWSIIQQHPLLGVGTGDYYTVLRTAYDHDQLDLPTNSHSQYLQVWATVGLWGLVVFIASLVYWYVALVGRGVRSLWYVGSAVLLFYGVVFLLDAVLLRQVDNVVLPLSLAMLYAASYAAPQSVKLQNRNGTTG